MAIDLTSQRTMYDDLRLHIGHNVEVVCYGGDDNGPENIAIECETCGTVLLDANREDEAEPENNNQTRTGFLMQLFRYNDGMAQAILDLVNTYREPGTPEYTGLAEISDARIRYWVRYEISSAKEVQRIWTPDALLNELTIAYEAIDAELEALGVKPTSEGWGVIRDYGNRRVRDTK